MAEVSQPPLSRKSFFAELSFAQLLTMVGMVGSLVIGAVSIYVAVLGQLNSLANRVDYQRQELTESSRQLQRIQEEQKAFTRDLYLQLSKVEEKLTELRITVAASSHSHANQPPPAGSPGNARK